MENTVDPLIYVTSAEEMAWGVSLVALTLAFHGLGMIGVLRFDNAYKARFGRRKSLFFGMGNLVLASWVLISVHLFEVLMWSMFFRWKQCFPNLSICNYFALNEYTTVGSSLRLPRNWRLLEGMISIAGVLAFAWSTGVLLTVAREFQAQQLSRLDSWRTTHNVPPADGTKPS